MAMLCCLKCDMRAPSWAFAPCVVFVFNAVT